MKTETKVLIAGTLGMFAVLGMALFKKLLDTSNDTDCYYDEFHSQLPAHAEETQHGVEYLSVL